MNEAFLIYLLSIAENAHAALDVAGNLCLAAALLAYGAGTVKHWVLLAHQRESVNDKEMVEWPVREAHNRKIGIWFGVSAGILWLVAAGFPSTESVLKAYALIEGSKVINAENAELAAEAVGKRFDRFLDIVDKGVNGRHSETSQQTPPPAAAPAK